MFGYMGKILYVDLTTRTTQEKEIDPQMAQDFIGGSGFATKILYDNVPAKSDPLGPENQLIIMTGPVTGTRFPTSGRFTVSAKSPLTGIMATSTSSGFFGVELKKCGFDGIVFTGKADSPVYLELINGGVHLRDATDIWGKDAYQTQDILREKTGEKRARIACIGAAGETLSPIACVMNDEGRAAGRGGTGAVMGSKYLKAVVARGKEKINVALPDFFNETSKQIIQGLTDSPQIQQMGRWGTASSMDMGWTTGDVPVKNWQVGLWKEGCMNLGGQKMAETILKPHSAACFNCPIRCARWVEIPKGRFAYEGPGPEYETLGSCGSMLLIDDLEAVSWIGEICNKHGMDTISAGCTVAWAMEAYEKGAITKEDTGGIELTWGNVDAAIEIFEQMGKGEGFGAVLAQGCKKAAEKIGKGTGEYAIHVKGMEVPMHDPRAFQSLAVNYATGTRGACHVQGSSFMFEMGLISTEAGIRYKQGRFDKKNKGLAAKVAQDLSGLFNSMAICMFGGLALQPSHIAGLMTLTTGLPYTTQSILQVGERILNLQRAFACREGITRKDDVLPERLVTPLPDGGAAGKAADLEYQLNEYYQLRGWNETGIPTKDKLQALGLSRAAEEIGG
ncbi:MAG: aldehyde ferredoxin oxidoreductase family protein [Desulfobacterales bacterium]